MKTIRATAVSPASTKSQHLHPQNSGRRLRLAASPRGWTPRGTNMLWNSKPQRSTSVTAEKLKKRLFPLPSDESWRVKPFSNVMLQAKEAVCFFFCQVLKMLFSHRLYVSMTVEQPWLRRATLSIVFLITCKVNKPLKSIFLTIDDTFPFILVQLFPFFPSVLLLECVLLAASCLFQ